MCLRVFPLIAIVAIILLPISFLFYPIPSSCSQHASADVERMVLGNKCDVNDKRQVSKEKGEKVGWLYLTINEVRTLFPRLCLSTKSFLFFLLLLAGARVWYQVHGDECKGEHQCRECKLLLLLVKSNFSRYRTICLHALLHVGPF